MKIPDYARRLECIKNDELSQLMDLISRDDIISFAGGIPDEDLFPVEKLQDLIEDMMGEEGANIFQYGSTEGFQVLKEYIVEFMGDRGIATDPERLLITSGSQQGLDLLCKLFVDEGDRVVVADPSYLGGIGAIKSYQADICPIKIDKDGLRVDLLEDELKKGDIKFVYTIPDHSNPSGVSLSRERRQRLLGLAEDHGFYILEDTPYTELSYYGSPPPSIRSMDDYGRVIYLGTFSKFFIPGFRIAWVEGPGEVIRYLGMAKQNAVLASNTFGQKLMPRAGARGLVQEQIESIKPYYKSRLEAMGQALEKYMPENTSWQVPRGGFFYWVSLPESLNSRDLLKKAVDRGVAYVNGNPFFSDYEKGNNYLRLSFSRCQPEEIERGIKRLARTIAAEM